MRFTALPQLETNFLNTGNNGNYKLKRFSLPVPGESLSLEGQLCTPVHRTGYFHDAGFPKERILLHFTAGHIRSDMEALTRQDFHVSVPFVIGRNGTIYQLYSSRFWSGNIGKGLGNAGNAEDKKTIAIEISNYGYLTERGGNLETVYSRLKDTQGRPGPVDVYCSLDEKEAYQKISAPFREQSFYASFTDEQYESLIILLRYLTVKYNIPRQFLPEDKRSVTTNDVLGFRGIVSHVNYRESGKWDIGPAFNWNRVIQGVQSASFQPTLITGRGAITDEGLIRSEEELEALLPAGKGIEMETEELLDIDSTAIIAAENEKKSLYALMVGIDKYREDIVLEGGVLFPRLRGCASDAKKVKAYLEAQPGLDLHIHTLLDSGATKKAVVAAFQEHLGQAGKGDTVLIYFSGHGTQEWADKEVWTAEDDGRLECLACYYDEQTKEEFLLADKELRFLIRQLSETGAHVVALFDCCHSGDNTRNGAFVQSVFEKTVEKRIPFSFKQRAWEGFVFSKQLSRQEVIDAGDAQALPQGLHVQLSACEQDESALEVNGEGVFTKAMLATLEAAKGDITYQALRSRVRQYLRNIYEQKPRIYVVNGNEALLYSTFLNGTAGSRSLAFSDVLFNSKGGWQLSLGAIHGIGQNINTIRVLDPENGNREYSATIKNIKADITELQFPKGISLDTKKVYRGYVENLLTTTLCIYVKNVDGTPEMQQALMEALTSSSNSFIKLDEKEPQYVINNNNGQLYLTKPGDDYRPLVMPLQAVPESVTALLAYIKQVAQWEHLRGLSSKGSDGNFTGKEIEVTIRPVKKGENKALPLQKDTVSIGYEKVGDAWKAAIEIELKNTTNTPLYCCALYLTYDFASVNSLLPRTVEYIEPGKSVKLQLHGNTALPFTMKEVLWYNWKEQTEYLKLIVNTDEFDAASLSLEALPFPPIPGTGARGLDIRSPDREPDIEALYGWGTQMVVLQQPNPAYNNVDAGMVREMLEDPATADFALGLYFDASVDRNMQPLYKLKSFVQKQAGTKGLLTDTGLDLANWWSRRRRNNMYRGVIDRFPHRIRIVSEGDSWFQHPLVLDIIDHLSRTYAVYCVAAAGDTLRNMQKGKKKQGEYYLDALNLEQPAFFLISAGGNDILGSKFSDYLQDRFDNTLEEGKSPERFLRESVFNEIASLTDIYRSLFQSLQLSHPKLQIIVHGYDYPVKLDDPRKGWLGRYMIKKGIGGTRDRQAIIQRILDEFNSRLEKVAAEFANVSYIDLRGTVRYNPDELEDQWYDEIHPNDDGFQQIAMKYIQKISEKAAMQ